MIITSDSEAKQVLSKFEKMWDNYKKDSTCTTATPHDAGEMNEAHRFLFGHYRTLHCGNCFKNLMTSVMTWYDQNKISNFEAIEHGRK